ncbi:uncharacterized protein LOC34618029 [Cyclospora cayetanensis]|uniref:Uncharacterized protein LOC34618029 n=1 Tax=Cyclospora cayetanensis TaxID=88456 RepID=A0A6P6RR02_9EIME|nr:uncharacterized protein LOC34618029 [Cyclospora cayetanensis]
MTLSPKRASGAFLPSLSPLAHASDAGSLPRVDASNTAQLPRSSREHALYSLLCCRACRVQPASGHPGASQPTPFGLNRYILLLIYVFITLSTSCVYFGWGPLSHMLIESGASLWMCSTEEQLEFVVSPTPACLAQDTSVQSLFTICYAAHFVVSGAAGVLIDTAGPKVTAVLGQILNICGWVFLGFSNEAFRATIPSFIFIGAGADMCFLPMLCIVNLFPGSSGFVFTALGAASSLSFAVPSMLRAVQLTGLNFRWVCWGYAVLGPAFSLLLVCLFVPLDDFIHEDMFVLVKSAEHGVLNPKDRLVGHRPHRGSILSRERGEEAEKEVEGDKKKERGRERYGGKERHTHNRGASSPNSLSSSVVTLSQSDSGHLSSVTDEAFFQSFRMEACSFLYFGICIYFVICSVAMNYYQQAAALFLLNEAYEALEFAIPLSTLPCIILGRLTDFVPVIYVMMVTNTAGALSFGLAIPEGLKKDFFSVCCFSVYISIFSSQVYIFVKKHFTSLNFGRLIGVASMLGGLVSLVSNPLYQQVTMEHDQGDPDPIMWGIFYTICGAYFLLIFMAIVSSRKKRLETAAMVLEKTQTAHTNSGRPKRIIEASASPQRALDSDKQNEKHRGAPLVEIEGL